MHKRTNLNKLDRRLKPTLASEGIGLIIPPRKNAAKKAFSAQRPRLATNTPVYKNGVKLTALVEG